MFVRRSARAGVLPVLALSLALAGCGGDDEIEPKMPDSSSAASTNTAESPSPTEPVEPTLPPEAEGDDAAAAEAFVRHYYDYVNYAQATGDTKGLKRLALLSCVACTAAAKALDKIYAKGGEVVGGDYHPVSFGKPSQRQLQPGVTAFLVPVKVEHEAQTVRGTETELDRRYEAGVSRLSYRVIRDGHSWHVAHWELRS